MRKGDPGSGDNEHAEDLEYAKESPEGRQGPNVTQQAACMPHSTGHIMSPPPSAPSPRIPTCPSCGDKSDQSRWSLRGSAGWRNLYCRGCKEQSRAHYWQCACGISAVTCAWHGLSPQLRSKQSEMPTQGPPQQLTADSANTAEHDDALLPPIVEPEQSKMY